MTELTDETLMPALPDVELPPEIRESLQPFIDAVRENLEVMRGSDARGYTLDKAVTFRDLVNSGIASVRIDGDEFIRFEDDLVFPDTQGVIPTTGSAIALIVPPAPTGVSATGAVGSVILDWDTPAYATHGYAEVWRSATNDSGAATRVGTTPAEVFADDVGDMALTYYYWVRFVSIHDKPGPFHAGATSGASATTLEVDSTDLADAAVTTAKLASLAVTTAKIASAAITSAKIADANITTAKIATANITTALIADAAISSAKIADASITSAKIDDLAVTTAKIAAAAITTAKIADASITSAKIGTAQVGTLLLGTDVVTVPSSAFTAGSATVSGTASTVQSVSVTISGDGAPWPVHIVVSATHIGNAGSGPITFQLKRGSTVLATTSDSTNDGGSGEPDSCFAFTYKDSPSSGSHTYTLTASMSSGANVTNRSMIVMGVKR